LRFEFSTTPRIIFGEGTIREAAPIAARFGDTALIVLGNNQERVELLLNNLKDYGVNYHLFSITSEPTIEMIQKGSIEARRAECDMVIAMGGGSVIDGGKAIAAYMTNPGNIYDYLEVVGKGNALINVPATFIAIPTTAGTGAEVTANAVLHSVPHAVKISLRSSMMLPKVAIVDPLLSLSMPPDLTASTGMDALTQLIEAFISPMGNPMTDTFCREGIQRVARSFIIAFKKGDHTKSRSDMALAALFSGMALANAKLGAVHGIAGPLGGMIKIPHGVTCACLLPLVLNANLKALNKRRPDAIALDRLKEIAILLTGNKEASAKEGIVWLENVCRQMDIPQLSQFGVTQGLISELVPKAQRASSMKGNPIQLTFQELTELIKSAC
jgi:alcohol dehydrogenase class IV